MRIAIISHYRSGSTSFCRWLSSELNLPLIIEPYNIDVYWNKNRVNNIESALHLENVVVKYLYNQFENEQQLFNVLNSFDKILLLTRENEIDSAISAVYAEETKKYHNTYFIDTNWINKHNGNIELEIENIKVLKNKINNISNGLHITYENIFVQTTDIIKIKEYIGIELFKNEYNYLLDNKRRYRNNKSKKLL